MIGNAFIACAHSNTAAQFWGVIVASVVAGVSGELFRIGPATLSTRRWNGFAFTVPAVYWAVLLFMLAVTMDGLWWSTDVIGGSVLFAGLTGLFINLPTRCVQ